MGALRMRVLRWAGRTLVLAAALSVAGCAGAQAVESSLDRSPYLMLSDPVAANPAAFPWRLVTLSVGPLAAEVESGPWTAAEVSRFLTAALSGGDWPQLPGGEAESLSVAAQGRVSLGVAAVQAGYGLAVAASGTLSGGALEALRALDGSGPIPSTPLDVSDTQLVAALWQDGYVRVNAPVPFIPRLLGIDGFSAGAGYHWLRGMGYFSLEGAGSLDPGSSSGSLTARRSQQGTGSAFEAGAVARINRFVAVEGAYLGGGRITWTGVEQASIEQSGPTPEAYGWAQAEDEILSLPDVGLLGLHLRPLASGLVELSGYLAQIGVGGPAPTTRLQAEASVSAWGLLRATLGTARDVPSGSSPSPWRLYASLGLGLGSSGLTLRAVNLQELGRGADAHSLGLSVTASLGF